jgi:hypothetical protein
LDEDDDGDDDVFTCVAYNFTYTQRRLFPHLIFNRFVKKVRENGKWEHFCRELVPNMRVDESNGKEKEGEGKEITS